MHGAESSSNADCAQVSGVLLIKNDNQRTCANSGIDADGVARLGRLVVRDEAGHGHEVAAGDSEEWYQTVRNSGTLLITCPGGRTHTVRV
jgi:hypothetical protein